MGLRTYQEKDSNRISENLLESTSILYQLPTGGGKTRIIRDIVEKNIDKKILLLVHKREIIFQIKHRLEVLGKKVGVIMGDTQENIDADILVGSILTVTRDKRIQGILDRKDDILIIDEAHHACSNSYLKFINQFKISNPQYKILGVTATPYRKDGKPLSKIFDKLIIGPTIKELQELGYLSKCKTYMLNLDGVDQVEKSGGDYKISDLSKYMRNPILINKAVDEYKRLGENKQMLVFCVDKKHSKAVTNAYIKAGYKDTVYIDSDTNLKVRDKIIKDFRAGKIKILVSIQTLNEGTDLPEVSVGQLLRPTLSLVLYLQMVGRIIRPKEDNSSAILLDISNCSQEHGLITSPKNWDLSGGDPNKQKHKQKLVGKRNNGSFTDNFDEIQLEDLELQEISHEEFLSQKQESIDEAIKHNKDIELKQLNVLDGIVKYLNNEFNILEFKSDINDYFDNKSENYKVKIISKDYKIDLAQLGINKNNHNLIDIDNVFSTWRIKDNTPLYKLYNELGEFSSFLTKKTKYKKLQSEFDKIIDLNNQLLDINKIKQKIEESKFESLESKIDLQIRNNNYVFPLKKEFFFDSYFRNPDYIIKKVDKIILEGNPKKLNQNVKIKMYYTSSWGDKKATISRNTDKDTFLRILKNYYI